VVHPIGILAIAVAIVFLCILRWRIHAFAALLLAAITVGLLTGKTPPSQVMVDVAEAFGALVGRIGIAIIMAAVIGQCLMDSGAADKITRRSVAWLGHKYASASLVVSGFVLSIPVFADTVFFLLIPLARAMSVRLGGKNYLLFVLAISAGASSTHVFVPPTPGPLAAAANLKLDLGAVMLAGLAAALPATLASWAFAVFADRRWNIPVRPAPRSTLDELEKAASAPEEKLPGFWISLAPIALPVLLIVSSMAANAWAPGGALTEIAALLGNPNMALLIAAAVAVWVLVRQKHVRLASLAGPLEGAIASGGLIVLITAAGGAFGAMLQKAGLGDELGKLSTALGLSHVMLAYLLSAMFKLAQGSGTVAMIASSAIMLPLIAASPPDHHPVYVFVALAAGSQMGAWMNDSGFWAFTSMAGLTELESLKSRSVMLAILSLTGLAVALLGSRLIPLG
jgi:gluconate:H+ symporter, GntP family